MRRPSLNHTNRGELVYDRFFGSGAKLTAAEITERVRMGIELDPKVSPSIRLYSRCLQRPAARSAAIFSNLRPSPSSLAFFLLSVRQAGQSHPCTAILIPEKATDGNGNSGGLRLRGRVGFIGRNFAGSWIYGVALKFHSMGLVLPR
jgi:hypothetical protein